MTGFQADVKYTLRLLKNSPGFTAIAIATLGLGIGANTVIFSGIESFLLRPLPLKEPDRLVFVRQVSKTGEQYSATYPEYTEWKSNVRAFEGLAALEIGVFNLSGEGEPRRLRGSRVNVDFFAVMGLAARLGRTFSSDEDRAGAAPSVVLSHAFWLKEFGGNRDAIGSPIVLDGKAHTILGVMPPELRFPMGFCEIWVPLLAEGTAPSRHLRYLAVVGRLAHTATLNDARAQTEAVAKRLEEMYPESNKDLSVVLTPLHDQLSRGPKRALVVMFVAVTFVLLICCVNLANMLLARAMHRHREIAIRMAVGADRGRLLRQLLVESTVLALLGGIAGLLIASWGVELLRISLPPYLQPMGGLSINRTVLQFTLGLSIITGMLFGLAPATSLLKHYSVDALRGNARSRGQGAGRSRASSILVVAEIAIATVLLIGAGLLVEWMRQLDGTDAGYDPRPVLTAELLMKSGKYQEPAKRWLAVEEVLRRLEATPGVSAASVVNWPPMTNDTTREYSIEGQNLPASARPPAAGFRTATAKYAQVMSIPVLKGRFIRDTDRAGTEPVVVVNDLFARRAWPDEDPVGKRIGLHEHGKITAWHTVVGIVGDVRHRGPVAAPQPEIYVPYPQHGTETLYVAVRTVGDPAASARTLESVVKSVDADLPVALVRPMKRVIADGLAAAQFTTNLITAFSGFALLLAAIGLYGVISYLVARRVHEFGVRLALGATTSDLMRLVLRRSLLLTGAGTLLGVLGGIVASRLLAAAFEGVAPDPVVFIVVAVLLTATAVGATWVPLRRAIVVGPLNALRDS
jgi:putative ABC transport system permease protein